MKQDKSKIIEQMLSLAALEEEQATYSQEEPVLSPDFRDRIMELNRQYLLKSARRKTQFRRWACAAAAALVIGTVGLTGAYSWWSYRFKAREKNAGWRIDYFIVSNRLQPQLNDAVIHSDIFGSDHCPVELVIR